MISAKLVDHMGSDLSVVNAARVSFNKKSEPHGYSQAGNGPSIPILKDKDKKLIKYLASHKHLSPFGHCFATFYCKAPIFVARQLVKHEYLRLNEISRRYVKSEPELFFPDWWREAVDDKKQGSGGRLDDDRATQAITTSIKQTQDAVYKYNQLLKLGVCEEQARMILPQNMITEFYWSGSLDAFAKMCKLRRSDDAQTETRRIAIDIAVDMNTIYPHSWEALQGALH